MKSWSTTSPVSPPDSGPTASAPISKSFFAPYPGAIAVYLHFPFCTNRCSYCDFYKEQFKSKAAERLFKSIEYETEMAFSAFGHEPIDIASIYIGGGTPSLIHPELLDDWIAIVKSYARFLPGYEFTIEVNPESLTDDFTHQAYETGINRLVVGVQSFGVGALRKLNRRQSTRDIYRAFYRARSAGFENIAADLIFGLPDQTLKKVRIDIERLTALEPAHISFYQLTVEPGTRLAGQVAAGEIILPEENRSAAMYRYGSHLLMDRGYRRYEVSNFAQDGFRSRHNYAYWNGSPYIGLGPGAHGFVNNFRYANVADIDAYIETVAGGFMPFAFVEELTSDQRLMERVMLSLRTADGIDQQSLIFHFGDTAAAILDSRVKKRFIELGLLLDDAGFLRLTDPGFLVADRIIADLTG